ncbi:3-oxoacyl-ACP reductase [Raphidocelis subcapitata]|uniref:3-oxoacyl-ACP reductase n=1 Tax=Raphidocelis subcapitata TaxID=307507 RepID=A0A2V0NT05_9CHLO|nr:3-oxoacyl-ACP reductase [Raphidocelis subcapitata]|eukprot:GBF88673.1 3-oxoacyl-ACP reductase [Raphidocelis subcapitata]
MQAAARLAVLSGQLAPAPCAAGGPAAPPNKRSRMFEGQVVLITGAGKGIGEAAALMFAEHGASGLVLSDLDAAALADVAARASALGARVETAAGDVTAAEGVAAIVAAAGRMGRLDVLVNNAGFTWDGVIHKMSPEQWDKMLQVHVTAPFRLIQALAPLIRDAAKAEAERDGRAAPRSIINISSTSGTHGNAGQANYAAGKAAVVGLTKTVAKEWGPLNVRANAIAFGLIDTRLTRPKEGGETILVDGRPVALGIPGADSMRQLAEMAAPLQRVGSARDAAGAILSLASEWSSYVTGQVLEVNGGTYM